ncbi:hypothetical protein [uncultured Brevundimonas sp.]|uniref:hypothetical protein n=1 Tax=uncultured Brevundimonas sp. TaxID=213418 RepID=UPI002629E15E|nr:hypothetical protein [uncultured Brevundimonas sp.]
MNPLRLTYALVMAMVLGLVAASQALADWHRVETPNFIVYGEGNARSIVREAEELERLDRMMRQVMNVAPSSDNPKLSVYILPDRKAFQVISPEAGRNTGGEYAATEFGITAILLRGTDNHVLFHEYAHHFMLHYFPSRYPAWFIEGFAEYFATADVRDAQSVKLGYYAPGRLAALNHQRWISMETLLTATPRDLGADDRANYYALSWLLTHYLVSDRTRLQKFGAYLDGIKHGQSWDSALRQHLDMTPDELRAALRGYLGGSMPYGRYDLARTTVPSQVTTLSASASDFLLISAALQRAVSNARAQALLTEARDKAPLHPNDPLALATLGNLEQVWGDDDRAEQAITRLLQIDPNHVDGLRFMAQLLIDRARAASVPAEKSAFLAQAQRHLVKAMDVDPTDFRIYRQLAIIRSFAADYPAAGDVDTLVVALSYAPQVSGLRVRTAQAMRRLGMNDEAEVVMGVLRNHPHGDAPEPPSEPAPQ